MAIDSTSKRHLIALLEEEPFLKDSALKLQSIYQYRNHKIMFLDRQLKSIEIKFQTDSQATWDAMKNYLRKEKKLSEECLNHLCIDLELGILFEGEFSEAPNFNQALIRFLNSLNKEKT